MNNFCLKLRFLRGPAHYIRFLFFFLTGVFSMRLFLFVFIEAPLYFSRNEPFCEHKELFRVFGTMQLTGDLHQKNFSKNFKKNFPHFLKYFLKGFRLRKMDFLLFPVGENGLRVLSISLGVFLAL